MKHLFAVAFVSAVAAAGCAAPEPAATSPALDPPARAPLEPHADGCGAGRHLGSAGITCDYRGHAIGPITASGVCVGDSQIICSFTTACEWEVATVATTCVEGGALCPSLAPPEASPPQATGTIPWTLDRGSTLCDPPRSAADLAAACNDAWWSSGPTAAREACRAEIDRNASGGSCCLNNTAPSPTPGSGSGSTAPAAP
jgi:hypothetical protein